MDATMNLVGIPESVLLLMAIIGMGIAGYIALNAWLLVKRDTDEVKLPPESIRNITVIGGKGWVPHPEDNLETED